MFCTIYSCGIIQIGSSCLILPQTRATFPLARNKEREEKHNERLQFALLQYVNQRKRGESGRKVGRSKTGGSSKPVVSPGQFRPLARRVAGQRAPSSLHQLARIAHARGVRLNGTPPSDDGPKNDSRHVRNNGPAKMAVYLLPQRFFLVSLEFHGSSRRPGSKA